MKRRVVCGAFVVALAVVGCRGEPPLCVVGDRLSCRCGDDPMSAAYGYQRCSAEGRFEGPCECTGAITPDAGPGVFERCGVAASYRLDCSTSVDAGTQSESAAGD